MRTKIVKVNQELDKPLDKQLDKPYWVAFNNFEGIGPQRFKLLINYFGSAQKAWRASRENFLKIGLGEKLVADFCNFRREFNPEDYFQTLSLEKISVLILAEKDYPELLRQIPLAPAVLYFKGKMTSEDLALAVVGTRKITSYGRQVTEILTQNLVAEGLTIVSGLARGVDSLAHKTAIEAGGRTIAVLGSGVDVIYPPENKKLSEEIIKNGGAVISEFPMETPPVPGNFPARNRIISGLSLGVLVTEAAEDSGSLITTSWAADQGREVFAVPGPITSPMSVGTAELIKKGAKLVYNVKDILEELNLKQKTQNLRAREIIGEGEEEVVILQILGRESLHIDEIVQLSKMETGKVNSIITLMEMKGKLKNLGGMVYAVAR